MRINNLNLIRYGHFSDEILEFPKSASGSDFQLVYGPNEAGKSSARLALEDFLFGIPSRSAYSFRHGSTNMQVGAQIQTKDDEFEAIRRKGRVNTLRDPNTNEAITDGDGVLLALLHHINRDTFSRMFSLDHERLHRGGQAMLDAEDDVGKALFAATAGLVDLQSTLDLWKAEAAEQWSPNKSKNRIYYQAKERFDAASKMVAERSVLARDWENRQRALEDVESQLESVREEIRALEPRQRKLLRIRRLKQKVSHYFETDQQISELGAVMELPEDSMEKLNGLVSKDQILTARIEGIEQRIGQLKTEREALQLDEKAIEDEVDIEKLNVSCVQISKSKLDLPEREKELGTQLTKFQVLSERLGLASLNQADIAGRIPSRGYSRRIRELIGRKGMLDAKETGVEDLLRDTTRIRERLEEELKSLGPIVDVDLLNAAVETSQKELDSIANLPQLQRQLEVHTRDTERTRRTLAPAVPEETDLESLAIPSREVILNMRDESRAFEKEQVAQRGKIGDAVRESRAIGEKIDSFLKDEELISEENLKALRSERDELWESLKADLLADSDSVLSSSGDLQDFTNRAVEFEDKVEESDALADKRFVNAEAEALHAELLRTRDQSERDLRDLRDKASEIENEYQKYQSRWESLWANVPFEVADPETMYTWWETRESLISAMRKETEIRAEVKQLTELEEQARERLHGVLGDLSKEIELVEFDTLAEALAFSRETVNQIQVANSNRKNVSDNLKVAKADVKDKHGDLEAIQQESQEWMSEWSDALRHINLSGSESPQQVAEKLDFFDELREVETKIVDLKESQIGSLKAEIDEFEDRVKTKVLQEYPDLVGSDAEDIVRQLKKRLDSSLRVKTRREGLTKQLSDEEAQKRELTQEHRALTTSIDQMRSIVGASDVETLRTCIQKSDDLRSLRGEQSELEKELRSDGDGLSILELKKECDSVQDLDSARSEESRLETQLNEWREQEKELLPKRTEAKMQLDEIRGSDEAAHAEFDKECALAEMRDAIEKYIPIRASAVVLEWAIERFRKERQGPLLKRASEIFNLLTLGSFAQIEVQMEGNKPALVAYRNNKDEVRLPGLSEGSLDQLYLALRVAALEEHIKGSDASIPFVADDLFINFDDERATAGLEVLLELSRKCQILFFTHHRHLVDLALQFAQDQVTVTELMSAQQAQAVST
ncbi:MAG: AAA family ATPase [Gammaproteobacteria bacterium]|nr:AAA family ATPase [Gammaproteobacteria bacterium]